jgi:serine protease Do
MEQNTNIISTPRGHTRGVLLAGGVLAALGAGYTIGTKVNAEQGATAATPGNSAPVVNTPATTDAVRMQDAFAAVAKAAEPAVVTITTERKVTAASRRPGTRIRPFGGGGADPFGGGNEQGGADPFEDFLRRFKDFGLSPNSTDKAQMQRLWKEIQSRPSGLGSGMIYRSDGLILTNAHVVRDADTVNVQLNDDREFRKAKVIGIDERTDVAVVKIDAENLPTVKFGDSNNVHVGDWAIAVGNPFGLSHTVTVGVISAKAREVGLNPRNPGDYLQTDASINPGNSGGPLLDIYGRVIGINNAIYSESGGNVGIGFAIPIDTARNIADQLVKNGKIRRAYLGVKIRDLGQDAQGYGLPDGTKGVLIEGVDEDTPGGRAGLQPGDVVVAFNGQTVTKSTELQRAVQAAPVGSKGEITVLRAGKRTTLSTTLEELKDENQGLTDPANPDENDAPQNKVPEGTKFNDLGVTLRVLTPGMANQLGIKAKKGLVITNVVEDSPAGNAGLKRGDVIERVAQTSVNSIADAQTAVKGLLDAQKGDEKKVSLYVNSQGQSQFVTLTITK